MLDNIRDTLPIKGRFDPKEIDMEIKINIPYLAHYPYIFDLLELTSKESPNINIIITNNVPKDIEKELRNKEYDLHIDVFESRSKACFNKILYNDNPVIICRKDHPRLSNKDKISLDDYLKEKHAVLTSISSEEHPASQLVQSIAERQVGFSAANLKDVIQAVLRTDFWRLQLSRVF